MTIGIRVRLFALYRDLAGRSQLELELPAGSTVGQAVARLRDRDGLHTLPPDPVVAVNQAYAAAAEVLEDGDELALIPPVAGG